MNNTKLAATVPPTARRSESRPASQSRLRRARRAAPGSVGLALLLHLGKLPRAWPATHRFGSFRAQGVAELRPDLGEGLRKSILAHHDVLVHFNGSTGMLGRNAELGSPMAKACRPEANRSKFSGCCKNDTNAKDPSGCRTPRHHQHVTLDGSMRVGRILHGGIHWERRRRNPSGCRPFLLA